MSAQIIYHCSTLPGSIPSIVIYIFTTGKVWHEHVLITYTIDGEVTITNILLITGVSHRIVLINDNNKSLRVLLSMALAWSGRILEE